MKLKIFEKTGKAKGEVTLADPGAKISDKLIFQMLRVAKLKTVVPTHTKTRAERRGGGIKPWRQKGTGRARVGSNRSPLWKKGGIIFGPRKVKNFNRKSNKKGVKKIINYLLAEKAKNKELIIWDIESKNFPKKTKDAEISLLTLPLKEGSIILYHDEKQGFSGLKNIPYLKIKSIGGMGIFDLLSGDTIIISKKVYSKLFDSTKTKKAK